MYCLSVMLSGKGETIMDEKEYSVSEAVRLVGVESHVLRYWEEELQVEIRRTAQGHRVYSESNIETFQRVRDLKDRGLQLKAIRVLLDGASGDLTRSSPEEQLSELGNLRSDPEQHACECENPPEKQTSEQDDLPENTAEQNCEPENAQDKAAEDDTAAPENGHAGESVEVCPPCRTVFSGIDEQDPDHLEQFEVILKSLIREVLEEQSQRQNQKQEQMLREILREEIRQMHLVYEESLQDIMREAAAGRESRQEKKGVLRKIRRLLDH